MQAVVTADVGKQVIVVVVDAAKMFRNKMGMKLGRRRYAAATHTRTRALTQIPGPDMLKFKLDGVRLDYEVYYEV